VGVTPTSPGLDRQRQAADLDSGRVSQGVQADADSALESGARGTPTMFVNGRLHLDGYDEATLRAALATAIKER
jgi:predicted DsbA family dithiol-disulfide isomerase